jgi:hypothetical protein
MLAPMKIVVLFLALVFAVSCDKKEEKKTEEKPAADTADKKEGEAKKADEPLADPTVCCQFGEDVAAARKSQCEGGGGKVLDKKPPC